MRGPMNTLQADQVVKAIVDGVDEYSKIAARSGVDPIELTEHAETIDRGIQLLRGFYKYGHENMKPAGLPPPPNPYLDKGKPMDGQSPEYFAFEAVQRNGMDRARCIFTCGQLGLDPETAATAIDNVSIPWRQANGWRSYAQLGADGKYVLMDKPPAKLKRHLDKLLAALV